MITLLFSAAWKGTLLVVFALVVHRFARNRVAPRWLCALLLVAIVRLLIPIAPAASFSIFNLLSGEAIEPPQVTIEVAPSAPPGRPMMKRAFVPSPADPRTLMLLGIWAAGALLVAARMLQQSIRFHRQLADSQDVDLGLLVDECRAALSVRRRVRVAETSAVATPSLHGWLRPALLLPQGFVESFPAERQRYVVLHELAHLRRCDVLINWIAAAAQAVHWFNPLVRLAVVRLAEERELACDALALAALRAEERPAYGGTVLELVDRLRAAQLVPALVGMTATPQQLKRRIVMIASFRSHSRYSMFFAAVIAAVALATLTDARAGEMKIRRMEGAPLSPIARDHMERLEQNLSVDLRSASIDDVFHAISNATGVNITLTEGALEGSPRVTLKGENVPAHLVLMETLMTFDLMPRFTDAGVEVVQAPERIRDAEPKEDIVYMKRSAEKAENAEKRIEIKSEGDDTHRKLTVQTNDGAPAGSLEITVEPSPR